VHASSQIHVSLALPIFLCIFFKVVPDSQLLLRGSCITKNLISAVSILGSNGIAQH